MIMHPWMSSEKNYACLIPVVFSTEQFAHVRSLSVYWYITKFHTVQLFISVEVHVLHIAVRKKYNSTCNCMFPVYIYVEV